MPDPTDVKFFLGLSVHFNQQKTYFTGTAGVGVSKRFDNIQPNLNLAINFYNGGLGTLENSNKLHLDLVASGGLTVGEGKHQPSKIYPLHTMSGSGIYDTYRNSVTLGTNFIFNNSGRNQQVAFLQLKSNDFTFQTYNDFGLAKKIGLSDGLDRWWTGGGNVTLGNSNSDQRFIVAFDVFTADTNVLGTRDIGDPKRSLAEFEKGNNSFFDKISKYTPSTAVEMNEEETLKQRGVKWDPNKHSFNLNQGRSSFGVETKNGYFGANKLGVSGMESQNMIHRLINFHLIPSERKDQWEFEYR